MPQLYANPYDIDASGFYFESPEEYEEKAGKAVNRFGMPVEEFMIDFIDGDSPLDLVLFKYMDVRQYNVSTYFEVLDTIWNRHNITETTVKIAALDEQGIEIDPDELHLRLDDIHVFEGTMTEYAQHYADQFLSRDFLDSFMYRYMNWEAYGRELRQELSLLEIGMGNQMYVVEVNV